MKYKHLFQIVAFAVSFNLHAGGGYKPIAEGKWPFETDGIRFTPYITDNWTYTRSDMPSGYRIYFYREGVDSVKYLQEGGIQLNDVALRFAGTEQMIAYIKAAENIYNDPKVVLKTNNFTVDKKYGSMCVRFSRTFEIKDGTSSGNVTESIRDEGYYFQHPHNPKMLYKVHLFKRSSDAIADSAFGAYMEKFYSRFSTDGNFVPRWTIGSTFFNAVGFSDGLYFGYVDAQTNAKITVDPASAIGLTLYGYRRIKGVWVAGAEIGFGNATSLSGYYDGLDAYSNRGFTAELFGGALLFSKFRHRLLLDAGPTFYSAPNIQIMIDDPNGPGDVTFKYKPAVGFAVNAWYVFVMKRRRGQLVFGFKYHYMNYDLKSFNAGGSNWSPSQLNPEFSQFKKPNASNLGIVMFGYQYTIN